jgi:D-alanyl-D-alanine carboxypeptidase
MRVAGFVACVAVLPSSCSFTNEPTTALLTSATTTATSPAPKNSALKTIDPQRFQAVVAAAADQLVVPGAMVLLRTPQGQYNAAVGTTELGAQTPPAANTHFRIASNTKTMTAALIVLLAQDGKLRFSDPVSAYVPDVPNGENITRVPLQRSNAGFLPSQPPHAGRCEEVGAA